MDVCGLFVHDPDAEQAGPLECHRHGLSQADSDRSDECSEFFY